jgi:hypothetical protein
MPRFLLQNNAEPICEFVNPLYSLQTKVATVKTGKIYIEDLLV